MVLLSGHHRSDSGRSAPPCRGSGEVRRLRRERRRQSCSPPPALLPPRRPQPGPDTSAQRPTRRSAAAAVAVAVGPSPSPRLSMEKWRRPLALARIRAVGLRARRLAPAVMRQLSPVFDDFRSPPAPRGTELVARPCRRFFPPERGSGPSTSALPLPAEEGPGLLRVLRALPGSPASLPTGETLAPNAPSFRDRPADAALLAGEESA